MPTTNLKKLLNQPNSLLFSSLLVFSAFSLIDGQVKKQGKAADDLREFRSHLDALGLKIIQVTSDGNCFFRAVADQLEGNEEEHHKYRNMVVQYILNKREDFEPFIEDGVPFDEYCKSMAEDGTWAGHMELQAASLVTRRNICIHRIMEPRWYIRNFNSQASIMHLSYHNEEHYNSVRLKDDPCVGPAKPIVIKADADLSATSKGAKDANKSEWAGSECVSDTSLIKLVMAGSGCLNANKVEEILQLFDGDLDAAIEFLIAEQGCDENFAENDEHVTAIDGNNGNRECEQTAGENAYEPKGPDIKSVHGDNSTKHINKKVPGNKVCPCGSKKKYKACCGSNKQNSFESVVNQRLASGKGRTQGKQNRKGGSKEVTPLDRSISNLDMGALCI